MANWALAMHHSRAGMVHSFSDRFKTEEAFMSCAPRPTPTTYPDDSPAMQAALGWLTQAGLRFTRPTRYQLKIGALSFYPDKGTLSRDGNRQALPDRGLPALQALLGNHPQPCPLR